MSEIVSLQTKRLVNQIKAALDELEKVPSPEIAFSDLDECRQRMDDLFWGALQGTRVVATPQEQEEA